MKCKISRHDSSTHYKWTLIDGCILLYAVKVDRDKQLVCVDELIEQITMEELQEQLPGHQPRYIVYRYGCCALAHYLLIFYQRPSLPATR